VHMMFHVQDTVARAAAFNRDAARRVAASGALGLPATGAAAEPGASLLSPAIRVRTGSAKESKRGLN